MQRLMKTSLALFAMTVLGLSGCGETAPLKPDSSDSADGAGGLVHPSEGPHGGDLIELGKEDFHAELVHPENHDGEPTAEEDDRVTIYILDGSARKTVAIEAADVTLNLIHDGKPEQFTLNALPTESDETGKSSRFASSDAELLEHFHGEDVKGTLVLEIEGKSYRGKIHHEH